VTPAVVGPRVEPGRQTWRLTPRQAAIWRARERFLVLVSGRRFGKTVLALLWLIREVRAREDGALGYYVAPFRVQAKAIAWDILVGLTRGMRVAKNESELTVTLPGGRKIALRGSDDPEHLEGVGLVAVVLDEFGKMKLAAWEKSIRPTLADRNGRALLCGKPRGHNHLKDAFDRGQPGPQHDAEWRSWIYTTADGGFVPQSDIAEAKRTLPGRVFRQEYEAAFEALAGRVYDEWQRTRNGQPWHLVPADEVRRRWYDAGRNRWNFRCIVVGVDWGRVAPGVMLAVGATGTGQLVVFAEEYHRDLLVTDVGWLRIAKAMRKSCAPVERFVADPSEPDNITAVRLALGGRPVVENADNSVADGIRRVSIAMLQQRGAGAPGLVVSDACVNTVREVEGYVWREVKGAATEEPNQNTPDHAMDALRYAVMALTTVDGRAR